MPKTKEIIVITNKVKSTYWQGIQSLNFRQRLPCYFCPLIILIILSLAVRGYAEEKKSTADNSIIEIQPIIINVNRTFAGPFTTSNNVKVTGAEQISSMPVNDLSQALSYTNGVDIEPRKGFGKATSISIQGSNSRHVRVMIDEIPMNSQASGQLNPSRMPIGNVKQIEVIKGAASNLWGSALGGVVNVVTKDTGTTKKPKINYSASYAEFQTYKHSLETSGIVGKTGYYLFGTYQESKGKDTRDDMLSMKTYNKLSYNYNENERFLLTYGYSIGKVNSGIYPDNTWQAQPYVNNYGKIEWQGSIRDTNLKIDLKHSRQSITTFSFLSPTITDAWSITRTKDTIYQLSVDSSTIIGENLLLLGADFDYNLLRSTFLTKTKSLKNYAPYISYKINKFYPFEYDLNLRCDSNSEYGDDISPSFGALYHIPLFHHNTNDTILRFNISRAFNAPPLLWKYYDRGASVLTINNEIEPETAVVVEAGIETNPASYAWVKLSFYNSIIKKAIAAALNDNGEWYMKNFQRFRRRGLELETRLKLYAGLVLNASGAVNDVQNKETKKQVRGRGIPRQSYNLNLEYKNKKHKFLVNLIGSFNRWDSNASAQPNDRKFIFDLKTEKKAAFGPAIELNYFLNIYNLTNSKYWSDNFFPIPERYFEGGITIKW